MQPAFPTTERLEQYQGMTLRDYFAAAALPAITTGRDLTEHTQYLTMLVNDKEQARLYSLGMAVAAYKIADAMLEVRDSDQ